MGAKLAPKAGRAFEGLGEGALTALKNWWKGPIKSPSEIKAVLNPSTIEEALADVSKTGRGAYERLVSSLKAETNEIKQTFVSKLNEAKALKNRISVDEGRLINQEKSIQVAQQAGKETGWAESAVENLRGLIQDNKDRLNLIEDEVNKANEFMNILDNDGVEPAVKYLQENKNLMTELPNLGKWKDEAVEKILNWHTAEKAQSLNLNKAKNFLKEYGEIMSRPADDPYRVAFMNNAENRNFLSSLRGSSNKISKMIREIEAPSKEVPRQSLSDTLKDWAKKLGVGAATMGIGTAAYKLYDWFHSNEPHGFSNQAEKIADELKDLKFFGQGASVISRVEASLGKIAHLSDQVNRELGENPEKAAAGYISQITRELSVISDALDNWNLVEQNSAEKDKVSKVGRELSGFLNKFNAALKNLGGKLGVSIGTVKNVVPKAVDINDVEKIQRLLNQEGFEIPVSGKVDEHTTAALRALEHRFSADRLGKDITGAFVNGNEIISYDDLKKALKILENQ